MLTLRKNPTVIYDSIQKYWWKGKAAKHSDIWLHYQKGDRLTDQLLYYHQKTPY